MPIVVTGGTPLGDALRASLPEDTTFVPTIVELSAAVAASPEEYAVVFGPAVDQDSAAAFSSSIRLSRPDVSAILVRHTVSDSIFSLAFESGIRDVVDAALPERLSGAVTRARQAKEAITGIGHPTSSASKGRVVTVFSPKGGVGKTTTAVNIALALADGGRHQVCIVDLDLAFGDVAITLQMFPNHTIEEASLGDGVDWDLLSSLLTAHNSGVQILSAPLQPEGKDQVSASLVKHVLETLQENFDYVVVDTSPSFEEHILQAFDHTDELVLVATLDVPTLKNVRLALETLNALEVAPANRWLVLNRADLQTGLDVHKAERILDMEVNVKLPSASELATATNSGRPIVLSEPTHTISQELRSLARKLRASAESANPALAATGKSAALTDPRKNKSRGLFTRNRK